MISKFRSFLLLFIAYPISALVGVFVALFLPFPIAYRFFIIKVWRRSFLGATALIANLDYKVEGIENIPKEPVVVLSKHQSIWETVALQEFFPPLVFVFKRSLLYVPLFGWALWGSRMIGIERTTGRAALMQVIRQGCDRLHKGFSVAIFPEGSRMLPGKTVPFKNGGALLACKAGVPVVPVAHNAGEYWQKGKYLARPGTITVSIGKPIDTTGKMPGEITKIAEEWIEGEMRRISPHLYIEDPVDAA